jgi:hypothetical protein
VAAGRTKKNRVREENLEYGGWNAAAAPSAGAPAEQKLTMHGKPLTERDIADGLQVATVAPKQLNALPAVLQNLTSMTNTSKLLFRLRRAGLHRLSVRCRIV